MTLRWRLTLLYTALLIALLALAAGGLLWGWQRSLNAVLDTSLRSAADTVAQNFNRPAPDPAEEVRWPPNADGSVPFDRNAHPAQAVDVAVYRGGQALDNHPSPVAFVAQPGFRTVQDQRVYVLPTSQGFWIQAVRSQAETAQSIGEARRWVLLGLPLLALLALVSGYALSDRALRPVDQVSALAARLSKRLPSGERVPQAPGNDEMARLTRTVNAMLEQLEAQLEHERLFAHAAAHELRTPLTVIRGTAALALEHSRSLQEYRDALASIEAVSGEMQTLTVQLLALARSAGPLNPARLDLADVVLGAAEVMPAGGIQPEVQPHSAPALGDAAALTLAASNLLHNALRHAETRVFISSIQEDGWAVLRVDDDGPGIPAHQRARLAQPFQRGLSEHSGGAGLGLALAAAIMAQHGGELHLSASLWGGLRAELRLPLPTL